ncbi:unnamed protein product [Rhizophagus irregularis]|nr:unnamed protein product [Rhizophagus irregularis]
MGSLHRVEQEGKRTCNFQVYFLFIRYSNTSKSSILTSNTSKNNTSKNSASNSKSSGTLHFSKGFKLFYF